MTKARQRGFNPVFVNHVVGVQRASNRFGRPDVEKEIADHIAEHPANNEEDEDFLEDETDSDDGMPIPIPQGTANWNSYTVNDEAADEENGPSPESSPAEPEAPPEVPHFARTRMNLTVLSQVFNLYFVAVRGKVHVYVPQNAPQILRETPLLILQPRPSELAPMANGNISRSSPHQINNMVAGQLGDYEVIVAAFDDGDVVAYYTHPIAAMIEHNSRRHRNWTPITKPPRQFFHVSVGRSAWGLAVHKKSRLIAVSSNLHEITVFAFALNQDPAAAQEMLPPWRTKFDKSPQLPCGLTALELEENFRTRTRDWRIILALPNYAQNLPSISFCDDDRGYADKVVAVDISGFCYIVDIWKLGERAIRLPPSKDDMLRCWGALVIPDKVFMPVETAEAFVGDCPTGVDSFEAPDGRIVLDITNSIAKVPNNPTGGRVGVYLGIRPHQPPPAPPIQIPAVFPLETAGGLGGGYHVESDEDEFLGGFVPSTRDDQVIKPDRWKNLNQVSPEGYAGTLVATKLDNSGEDALGTELAMVIVPSSGLVYRQDGLSLSRFFSHILADRGRQQRVLAVTLRDANQTGQLPPAMARRFSILRTCETGVELCSPSADGINVMCRRLLELYNPRNVKEMWDVPISQQIAIVHLIPELSTVVVGSMCGRVALLRLTKVLNGGRFRTGFRVEWLLPRVAEESAGLRPHVWLAGMSVSPVPQVGAQGLRLNLLSSSSTSEGSSSSSEETYRGGNGRGASRGGGGGGPSRRHGFGYSLNEHYKPTPRWRLFLHYLDHTVLTYTIEGERAQDTTPPPSA